MGGVLALFAALSFTLDNIFIRKGLLGEKPGTVWDVRFIVSSTCLMLFIIGAVVATLLGYPFVQELMQLSLTDILLLVVAGILGPFAGAFLFSTAIAQIGASHTSALWTGANPLFAALLGVVFMGDIPDLLGIISVLMIIGGILIVGYHGHAETTKVLETKLAGGLLAILSGVCIALSQVVRGTAMTMGATTNTALFVYQGTAFFVVTAVLLFKRKNLLHIKQISRRSLLCYTVSGTGMLLGSYFLLASFNFIPVWQAVAIRNIQPLFAILFSCLLLKKVDRISFRLVLGATLVTAGVVILNVY
ncbi:DMT family transporter [Dethiobacter alkaliphilus]|nr:EamA family transporter [Dethiobacter alkaliphilus]